MFATFRPTRSLVGFVLCLVAVILAACRPTLTSVRDPAPTISAPPPHFTAGTAVPPFGHIFIIVMENHGYDQIVGNRDAPFINGLARVFASAGAYYAIRHPSLPNYLALFSGSTQGMTYDCTDCSFSTPNLVDQLESHGKTWRAYQEDLPIPCFQGSASGSIIQQLLAGAYVRRHDPFMNFTDISQNPRRCANVVPLTNFAADLKANQMPDFVWITPNLAHDMHNGTVAQGDSWLAGVVPQILDSAAWKDNGLLIITWDEAPDTDTSGCCGDSAGGRVLTLIIGANSRRGYVSHVPYNHYSLLRTIEDAWGLGTLAHTGDPGIHPMADFFHN